MLLAVASSVDCRSAHSLTGASTAISKTRSVSSSAQIRRRRAPAGPTLFAHTEARSAVPRIRDGGSAFPPLHSTAYANQSTSATSNGRQVAVTVTWCAANRAHSIVAPCSGLPSALRRSSPCTSRPPSGATSIRASRHEISRRDSRDESAWSRCARPRTRPMFVVLSLVLRFVHGRVGRRVGPTSPPAPVQSRPSRAPDDRGAASRSRTGASPA